MAKNKNLYIYLISMSLMTIGPMSISSCKTKEGCGYEEKMAPKTDKYGRLSTKKGKTRLFK